LTIFIDPIAQEKGVRDVYGHADLILLTSQESESSFSSIKGDPFIVHLPGEYSHRGIMVLGFDGGDTEGKFLGKKTTYLFETEDMKIVHLGTAGSIPEDAKGAMNGCDILMIPVGGNGAFSASSAAAIARTIEPKVIIPMYYSMPSVKIKLDNQDVFYGEMAVKDKEILSKFTVKDKDIVKRNMDIVELTPQRG
jgi:L-ascorbate metabolism protein UlaG (beta-lactamase superfamily)